MFYRIATFALWLVPFTIRDRIKSIKGLARFQRAILSSLLNGREFEHRVDAGPAKGIRFLVKMPDDKGIWTGTYELDFALQLAESVTPDSVVYDIGSWHGFFAGVMAAQGASSVHMFEPLPANIHRINQLIALNPDKSLILHATAVGETDSEMDLVIMPDSSMAKLESSSFQKKSPPKSTVNVTVRSIDAMIAAGEIDPPSLIKIDVEGAEVMVLQGARETIRNYKPLIFMEVHSTELLNECRGILEANGYGIDIIDQDLPSAVSRDVFQVKAASAPPP